jgi:hypothetical protein
MIARLAPGYKAHCEKPNSPHRRQPGVLQHYGDQHHQEGGPRRSRSQERSHSQPQQGAYPRQQADYEEYEKYGVHGWTENIRVADVSRPPLSQSSSFGGSPVPVQHGSSVSGSVRSVTASQASLRPMEMYPEPYPKGLVSGIHLNLGYFKTNPGLAKLVQLVGSKFLCFKRCSAKADWCHFIQYFKLRSNLRQYDIIFCQFVLMTQLIVVMHVINSSILCF